MRLAAGPEWSGEIWQSALAALERKYSKPVFEMWLKPMRATLDLHRHTRPPSPPPPPPPPPRPNPF